MSKKKITSDIEIIYLHTKRNTKRIILNQHFNSIIIISILIIILGIVSKILSNHLKIERSYSEDMNNTKSNSNKSNSNKSNSNKSNRNKSNRNNNEPTNNCSPCDENIRIYYRS